MSESPEIVEFLDVLVHYRPEGGLCVSKSFAISDANDAKFEKSPNRTWSATLTCELCGRTWPAEQILARK